jgi:hypothetical protein
VLQAVHSCEWPPSITSRCLQRITLSVKSVFEAPSYKYRAKDLDGIHQRTPQKERLAMPKLLLRPRHRPLCEAQKAQSGSDESD